MSPNNATNKSLNWKSSNTSVANVDANGNVKAIKAGTATITVTAKDGSGKKDTCKVTVTGSSNVKVKKVDITKSSLSLSVGKTSKLTATVTPSNATNKALTWTSSNKNIATVDANGNVKGIKAGTATITATSKDGSGKKDTCKITVTRNSTVKVKGVKLNKTTLSLAVGKSVTLKATVSPSNATNKTLIWTSSNSSVVTVTQNGKITRKKAGTVTITVKTKDQNKIATCKVI